MQKNVKSRVFLEISNKRKKTLKTCLDVYNTGKSSKKDGNKTATAITCLMHITHTYSDSGQYFAYYLA